VDGTVDRVLHEQEGDAPPQGFAVWSPDGAQIAFTATDTESKKDRLYVVNADGSDRRPVTTAAGEGCEGLYGISWSPDGALIAFTRGCWDGDSEVWVVDVSTGVETHVAGATGARPTRQALNPVWARAPVGGP
jgi:Tol biopolymer transport system component